MGSKGFATGLALRVGILTLVLTGLSFSIATTGYYGISVLSIMAAVGLVLELYRHVLRTNRELTRFLEAARCGDLGQRFDGGQNGAGFDQLAAVFTQIMADFKTARTGQEERLRQLQSMVEHIPVPLVSLFPDGRIELRNHAARRLFGQVRVGRLEDVRAFGDVFWEALSRLQPGSRTSAPFVDDCMERQLTLVATQIMTGEVSETLISLQDIQSELDQAQLQAWRDLVRVLTHEIMNSITPVVSLARTATDLVDDIAAGLEQSNDLNIRDALGDVRRAVDTTARRSEGLMQFVAGYRSVTLLPEPQKKSHGLRAILEGVQTLLVGQWRELGIQLIVRVEPRDLTLFVDADLIEQVLINLLKNAEQALAGREGSRVEIRAGLNLRGHVVLEVADNGPGVAADIVSEIFVPFFTTKREGSGVGLALSRQIMIAHGGSMTVRPSDLGGAGFVLIF